ncbi:hypothetical protein BDK51DRAFT_40233 [Blyttiomyces helicus]|uniref:Uncharacterized protein n=1 Tax=Blyttiomyces helicus TaxID=388810 RepID=A0A4P9WDX1_9FUNG|nr:hypothetical protein BDK51DRAFT_40233 [Blyttiomyces helicus]|eukprot:RKO89160.1 hypothetical protein BDK51DRAFT_40233 [Blyttiomyces helicus]
MPKQPPLDIHKPKQPPLEIKMSILSEDERKTPSYINLLKVFATLKNQEGVAKEVQEIYNNLPTSTNRVAITTTLKKWNACVERLNLGIGHHAPDSLCDIVGHHRICRGKKSDTKGKSFTYWVDTILFPIYERRDALGSPGRHHPYARGDSSLTRSYAAAVAAGEADGYDFIDSNVEAETDGAVMVEAVTDFERDAEGELDLDVDTSTEGHVSPISETNEVQAVTHTETDYLSKTPTIGFAQSTSSTIAATSTPSPKKYADASTTTTLSFHEYADAATSPMTPPFENSTWGPLINCGVAPEGSTMASPTMTTVSDCSPIASQAPDTPWDTLDLCISKPSTISTTSTITPTITPTAITTPTIMSPTVSAPATSPPTISPTTRIGTTWTYGQPPQRLDFNAMPMDFNMLPVAPFQQATPLSMVPRILMVLEDMAWVLEDLGDTLDTWGTWEAGGCMETVTMGSLLNRLP